MLIHYCQSRAEADNLCQELNSTRPDSARTIAADLKDPAAINELASLAASAFGQLDILINNASNFYPTPLGSANVDDWDDLFASNAKAPFFLIQSLAPALRKQRGNVINIADIYASRPLKNHTLYCMAKAANIMLTKSMALELAPSIRVNGIAPGAIIWPEHSDKLGDNTRQQFLDKVPLKRMGDPDNIASAVADLIKNDYINGQVIAIDGGRSLT